MESIRKIRVGKMVYELPSSGKFNVILGSNAVGKTTLTRLMLKDSIDSESKKVYVINSDFIFNSACKSDGDELWIMDEEWFFRLNSELIGMMIDSKAQFVIMARAVPKSLPVSYKDIFTFRMNGKYYKLTRVYNDYDDFIKSSSYVIEGENGKAEHEYCSKWLTNVLPAGGNSNAVKHTEQECVILDGAACGGFMEEALRFKKVYLPISFEERVYVSLFRNDSFDSLWWKSHASLERYYTYKLTKDAASIGIRYSKNSNLHKRILDIDIYGVNRDSDAFRSFESAINKMLP